jgi:HNH endonuclease
MENIEIKKHPRYSDYGADINGNIYSFKHGKVKQMQKCPHGRGYQQFVVSQYGDHKMYLVHRFVYECWSEKMIDKDMQCHHIDHDKTNNAFENLEIVTQLMNMHYGKEAGVLYGAASPNHPFYNR